MFLVAMLIFQACINEAFTQESTAKIPKCTNSEETVDGYTLLALNATFRLVETTFKVQYGDSYRCVTATATEKEDRSHEVTAQVKYKVVSGNRWDDYSETLHFKPDDGTENYNKMESRGPRGAPAGTYLFLSTNPKCTVIKALSFKLPDNGPYGIAYSVLRQLGPKADAAHLA
ncbi:hypothetical protein V5799_030697 [Amblyomma americanum]|uniref:Lipocalin-6 1 n=1 Tax=Amblyomma americanum TaxID=6943 RepID=A0AAQ4EN12_AMBAM